jgi:hypothetical protein
VSGFHCLDLRLDHASLHLTEDGFTFFQRKPYLFRPDSRSLSLHLCHQLPLQNAASQTCLYPNSELHQQTSPPRGIGRRPRNGSPDANFTYLDGRAPTFDTVPPRFWCNLKDQKATSLLISVR